MRAWFALAFVGVAFGDDNWSIAYGSWNSLLTNNSEEISSCCFC